jgi:short-subunit dehydrogenase
MASTCSKAFVLAFSQSLQHELTDKGVRVQAVLPGATATDFWAIGGLPVENLDASIVMSAEDLVDAALLGFERGEKVSIPRCMLARSGMPMRPHAELWQASCPATSSPSATPLRTDHRKEPMS